jgi:type VI secretion system secreted protein Hcp
MAEDMYLKIGDIEGETSGALADQIRVISWNFGAKQPATMHVNAGGGASSVSVRDLQVVKFVDKATPNLFAACAKGTHYKDALLTVRKAGGEQIEYLKIHMEQVIISSYDVGQEIDSNEKIKETISINCARIKIEYAPQAGEGGAGGTLEGGWDMSKPEPWPA